MLQFPGKGSGEDGVLRQGGPGRLSRDEAVAEHECSRGIRHVAVCASIFQTGRTGGAEAGVCLACFRICAGNGEAGAESWER